MSPESRLRQSTGAYIGGEREQRQHIIGAAAKLGMTPTTEGASDLWLNLTHAIDGFSGNEHSFPITPLYEDVIQLYAKSRFRLPVLKMRLRSSQETPLAALFVKISRANY
jgi:hypothetical protein